MHACRQKSASHQRVSASLFTYYACKDTCAHANRDIPDTMRTGRHVHVHVQYTMKRTPAQLKLRHCGIGRFDQFCECVHTELQLPKREPAHIAALYLPQRHKVVVLDAPLPQPPSHVLPITRSLHFLMCCSRTAPLPLHWDLRSMLGSVIFKSY
jgi:hypothetical protein